MRRVPMQEKWEEWQAIEIPVVPVRRMVYLFKPPRLFEYDLPLIDRYLRSLLSS